MQIIIFSVLFLSSHTLFAQDINASLTNCISKGLQKTLERSDCDVKHELVGDISDITQTCKLEALDQASDNLSGAKAKKNFDSDELIEHKLNYLCGHKGKISYKKNRLQIRSFSIQLNNDASATE